MRLDRFLAGALPELGEEISRSALQRLIDEGGIAGIPASQLKASFKAKQPITFTVTIPGEKDTRLIPFAADIPVLYQDEYLAIVHKPAGMTVHPGAGTGNDTMVHALLGQLDKLAEHAERPGIVHRLDRETEGLMVIAKTEKARAALSELFAERRIQKVYSAIVWGSVTLPEEISGYIWRDLRDRKKMKFGLNSPGELSRVRTAEMRVLTQVRHRYGTSLEIELVTGRTHQIRATCAHYHAPIVGDALYGDDVAKCKLYKIGREKREKIEAAGMLLIAQSLSFAHPFKRKRLEFSIDLPARFAEVAGILSA